MLLVVYTKITLNIACKFHEHNCFQSSKVLASLTDRSYMRMKVSVWWCPEVGFWRCVQSVKLEWQEERVNVESYEIRINVKRI